MPESREDVLTPEVVKQRILMSVCYKFLRKLNFILVNSFSDAKTPALNLQEFVRVNIPILKATLDKDPSNPNLIWFYDYNDPYLYPAPVKICSNDKVHGWMNSTTIYGSAGNWRVETDFHDVYIGWTVLKWMESVNAAKGFNCVQLIQYMNVDPSKNDFIVMRVTINPSISVHEVITHENFHKIFVVESPVPFEWFEYKIPSDKTMRFGIRVKGVDCPNATQVGGVCKIHSGHVNGKWLRSAAQFYTVTPHNSDYILRKSLEDVWDSWFTFRL
jgi:hypothetical protein